MDLKTLNQQEAELVFEGFTSDMALSLAQSINERTKKNYDKPVGINVYYDDKTILHFLMEGRKEAPWLFRKRKTVLESGHSSLYVFFNIEDKVYQGWEKNPEHAICGGGFPINVNGEIRGAICVSGLDHLDDHQLIIDALKELLKK